MRKFFLTPILALTLVINPHFKPINKIIIKGNLGVYQINLINNFFGDYDIENNSIIDEIVKKENLLPVNAKLKLTNFSACEVVPEIYGVSVDKQALLRDLKSAKDLGGGTVCLQYHKIKPKYTQSDIEKCKNLRGEFSTSFSFNPDRILNITLATNSINSQMVDCGNTFSFNEVVGKRTESRGYKMAKIILNGEFVEGVGGGVCQASTTLYNTALLSGLEILEHHRHSLLVSYVEPSFDAMVNESVSDLKFQNCTSLPIFIFGKVTNSAVIFKIYGEKKDFDIIRESVVVNEILPKNNIIINKELNFGQENVIVLPKKGCISQGYVKKVVNGEVVNRNLIRNDRYLAVDGVTEVGENLNE